MIDAKTEASADEHSIKLNNKGRISFAIGGSATGLVTAGFSMFVLFYYNNVLGVPASLVGASLAIALVFDAVSDPIVGYVSDRYRSKLGRRHPFMYLSVLPVSVFVYALWNPPIELLSPVGLFLYLTIISISLRLSLTLFDVPSNAMVPELTKDYHERTRIAAYRVAVMWGTITVMSMIVYGIWLSPTPEYPNGLLNPDGYAQMGKYCAIVVGISIIVCSVGLHHYIPGLHTPSSVTPWTPLGMFKSIGSTLSDTKLIPVLLSGLFVATGFTFYSALFTYLFGYFWQLTSEQLSMAVSAWLLGVVLGSFFTRLFPDRSEKKDIATTMLVGIILSTCTPIILSLAGLFPERGTQFVFYALWCFLVFDQIVYIGVTAMMQSMISDVVEHRQVNTGAREEGTIYSGLTLILKFSSAISVYLAGVALDFIEFPTGATLENIEESVLINLAIVFAIGNAIFYGLSLIAIRFYSIRRTDFDNHLNRLSK